MKIQTKRAYEKVERSDGVRILADRLWPRGVSKEEAKTKEWLKDLTPSKELRTWYHEDKEKRFTEFKKRYRAELKDKKDLIKAFQEKHKEDTITLISANKDLDKSHIPTLVRALEK